MEETRADILLHPIRLRIVQAIESGRRLTVRQISRMLDDVPQATLYRHVNKLVEAGFLIVVDERPAGGTKERIYAVADGAATLPEEDIRGASKADHMRYFAAFCAMLMNKFDQYLRRFETIDLAKDGVGYQMHALYLTDDEWEDFILAINEPFKKALQNQPAPGRRPRLMATVVMPETEPMAEEELR